MSVHSMHTMMCDRCGAKEDESFGSPVEAMREARRLGWKLSKSTGDTCARCVDSSKEQLGIGANTQ